jgi:polyvinyl alcohol dehydrogenase (cytochrome)
MSSMRFASAEPAKSASPCPLSISKRVLARVQSRRVALASIACSVALATAACSMGHRSEPSDASAQSLGAAVFAEHCAVCHSQPLMAYMLPQMRGRPPGFVYDALSAGPMRRVGQQLDEVRRRAVAEFFTGVSFDSAHAARAFEISPACDGAHAAFDWSDRAYPSWGGSPRNARAVVGAAGLTRAEVAALEVDWVVAFPEATQLRSQPTAAGGALFVGSHNGSVYALDQQTGCTRWQFKADTEVRSAITIDVDERAGADPTVRALFGDRAANVYALDAETGALLWKRSVDTHPSAAITGSLTASFGMLFVPLSSNEDVAAIDPGYPCCTHAGKLVALDAQSGEIRWIRATIDEPAQVSGANPDGTPIYGPSGASIWNTPSVSERHGLVFAGSGNNHSRPASLHSDSVLALDPQSGRVVWTYQSQAGDAWNSACLRDLTSRASCPDPEGPDTDFGAGTLLVEVDGAEVLIAGQKSGEIHALDPATGELRWRRRLTRGGPEAGVRYGMAARDGVIYAPSNDGGSGTREEVARNSGLFAYSVAEGRQLWTAPSAGFCAGRSGCSGAVGSPALAMAEVVILGTLDGSLFALDRRSGEIVWNFDTARSFVTALGRPTQGGAITGTAGPLVASGRLFVSSGYGQAARPGNALIALSPRRSAN